MRRIVWTAVALLVMVIIMGIGLHTLNEIDKKNKEYREREAGQVLASKIAVVTETTSIWERLKTTTAATGESYPVEQQVPDEGQSLPDGDDNSQQEVISPEASEVSQEQTTTVTNDLVVYIQN